MAKPPPTPPPPGSGQYSADHSEPAPPPVFVDEQNRPVAVPRSRQPDPRQHSPSPPPTGETPPLPPSPWVRAQPTLKWLVPALITAGILAAVNIASNGSSQPTTPTSATSAAASSPAPAKAPTPAPTQAPSPSPVVIATTPRAAPQISVQQKAQQRLNSYLKEDFDRLNWKPHYIAVLATKNGNTYDRTLDTRYFWVDVLAEHEKFRFDPLIGTDVRILSSLRIGDGLPDDKGRPLLMTIFDPRLNNSHIPAFNSNQDVTDWCAARFPDLNGKYLTNQCYAAKMTPAR